MDMFSAMINDLAISLKSDASACLSKEAAILDWMGLGIHTGSHLGEYGQSKCTKGKPFATVPNNDDAGEWAGTPLAFIRDDFEFYDKLMTGQNYRDCLKEPRLAQFLHICFRYDKSKKLRVPTSLTCRLIIQLASTTRRELHRELSP